MSEPLPIVPQEIPQDIVPSLDPIIPEPPVKASHDSRGKFAKGNKSGVGNKYAEKIQRYKAAAYKCVTPKDFEEIVQRAVASAKRGDHKARDWITTLLLGKPKQEIDMQVNNLSPEETKIRIEQIFGTTIESLSTIISEENTPEGE